MRILFLLLGCLAALAEPVLPTIELRDQFDHIQKLTFPTERMTILTVADRKGNDEIDEWISGLRGRLAGRAEFKGIAQVSAVPSFLQNHVRKKFQESRKYPVMMDWSGQVCERLQAKAGGANVLVLDREGQILRRFFGKASPAALDQVCALVDKAEKATPGTAH